MTNEVSRIYRKGGTAEPTRVVGVRADNTFWEKIDEFAYEKGMTRNCLIVKAIREYMEKHRGKQ